VDFPSLLKKAQQAQTTTIATTHELHITPKNIFSNISYKTPTQPDTGDGNTVDVTKERNLFLKNSLEYQYGLRSIDGTIKGIRKAINGGKS